MCVSVCLSVCRIFAPRILPFQDKRRWRRIERSCSGARSNPAHRPSRCNDEDDSDSHSDDRRWKMNSKDEKEEEEEKDGAKEAADNQFDDSE